MAGRERGKEKGKMRRMLLGGRRGARNREREVRMLFEGKRDKEKGKRGKDVVVGRERGEGRNR